MMRAPVLCFLMLVFAGTQSACTTGSEAPAVDELKVEASANAPRPAGALDLGPIENEELRRVIYKGLEARLGKTLAVGEGAEETTEIGDYESFRFTIIKLTHGTDDVSGDPRATPDGMDVEVSGWFKRTVSGAGEAASHCTGFDGQVTLLKRQGEWAIADEHPVTFGREDPEDCY